MSLSLSPEGGDVEVVRLVTSRDILPYKLEVVMETAERGVAIRREMLSSKLPSLSALSLLPYKDYDYTKVMKPFWAVLQAEK